MFKVAICDDEQPIREYLKSLTEKCMDASVRAFADGETLLADETAYDIILLDISLNQNRNSGRLNGMDVAKKIREKSVEPLLIKVDGNYIKIPVNNIVYAENEARKIVLHTKNMKQKTYRFYEKMEVLERKMKDIIYNIFDIITYLIQGLLLVALLKEA